MSKTHGPDEIDIHARSFKQPLGKDIHVSTGPRDSGSWAKAIYRAFISRFESIRWNAGKVSDPYNKKKRSEFSSRVANASNQRDSMLRATSHFPLLCGKCILLQSPIFLLPCSQPQLFSLHCFCHVSWNISNRSSPGDHATTTERRLSLTRNKTNTTTKQALDVPYSSLECLWDHFPRTEIANSRVKILLVSSGKTCWSRPRGSTCKNAVLNFVPKWDEDRVQSVYSQNTYNSRAMLRRRFPVASISISRNFHDSALNGPQRRPCKRTKCKSLFVYTTPNTRRSYWSMIRI